MAHDWRIRRATKADAEKLRVVISAAYAGYAGQIDDLPDVAAGIEADIDENLVFVVENNAEIGGGMVLVKSDAFLLLANIAVDPSHSGQGLGRLLMNRAEDEARRLGFDEMRLSTHVKMPDNVALYIHLGWQETGRSGSKVLMSKKI